MAEPEIWTGSSGSGGGDGGRGYSDGSSNDWGKLMEE